MLRHIRWWMYHQEAVRLGKDVCLGHFVFNTLIYIGEKMGEMK